MTEQNGRERFVHHLNDNPPTKHRLYARYLAKATYAYNQKGTRATFGHWLRERDRPEFERMYVEWCTANGATPRPLRRKPGFANWTQ